MKAHRILISAAVAAVVSPAGADNLQHEGYVIDSRNVIVISGAGHCWHTSQWSPALAVEPCDSVPRAAAAPQPAPEPKQAVSTQQAAPAPVPGVRRNVDLSADALFAFDEAALQPEGKSILDDFAHQLSAVDYDSIFVVGHADRIGSDEYNQKLSERRANAVKEYLASAANIPANRISVDAKGESEPVTRAEDCKGNGVVACLAPDRRVHLEVTGTKEVTASAR